MKTAAILLLGISIGGLIVFFGLWAWLVWYMQHSPKPPAETIVNLPDTDDEWGSTS